MATWKKVAVSGSNISQFNNDAGYLTSVTAQHAFTTASFNGTNLLADSSQGTLNFASGSGEGLTISATAGTDTLTFGLSSIPNTSLENSTISGISLGSDLANLIVDDATLTLDSGTTYNGGTAKTISVKDGGIDTDAIADSLGTIGVNSFTGSFSGSFTGDVTIDLADLTAGAGLLGSAYDGNTAREFSVDSGSLAGDGLTTDAAAGTFEVQPDSTTGGDTAAVSVSANGVGLDVSTITGASTGALSTDGGGNITVQVDDSTIEVNSGTNVLQVKDGGIDTDAIADSLGTLGQNSFTGSFTGSYFGDGSGLSGVSGEFPTVALGGTSLDATKFFVNDGASKFISGSQVRDYVYSGVSGDATIAAGGALTIANDAVEGTMLNTNVADTTTIELSSDTLSVLKVPNALTAGTGVDLDSGTTYDGSGAKTINLDITEIITGDAANRVLTSDGDGTLTAETNFTFDGTDLTVTGNQLITGDLTVQGTASFQNNQELVIEDRFILMASGSTTAGDGGIVVQQTTQNVGELFAFDSAQTRWGLTGSFNAGNTAYTPDAFMAAVVEGVDADPDNAPARYDKKGNIFVGTDEGIWIYS